MKPAQASAPASRFLDGSDTRLHLLSWQGAGPPLLIVHGNTHAGGVYEPLALRLSDRFQVNALDLRGHGLSGQPAITAGMRCATMSPQSSMHWPRRR